MEKITAGEAARLLEISIEELNTLKQQGLIHFVQNIEGAEMYSSAEIEQIKHTNERPSLSQEAALINNQIQREIFTSVSRLEMLRKKLAGFGIVLAAVIVLLILIIATLFYFFPLPTSDFFGYYYRFNAQGDLQILSEAAGNENVLAASIGPDTAPLQTSALADVLKPVAATSLVLVKAVDSQRFQEIAADPFLGTGPTGPPGSQGPPGNNGSDGLSGPAGPQGLQGIAGLIGPVGPSGNGGSSGSNGSNGTNGLDGSDGTSVDDVMTTVGDITIRDSGNLTARLGAGTDGQVLTIASGVPAWLSSGSGSAFSALTNGTNTTAAMLVGTGASLAPTGSGTITASAFSGSSLTASNFTSANISQWTNNSGYISAATTDVLSNKTISTGSNTISGLTNTNLSGTAGITNANLANSSLSLAGNSGSGSVSLGGTLTLTGAGITTAAASGSTVTLTSTEADTLQSVYGRGNTITTATASNIAFTLSSGLVTPTSMVLTNNGTADSFLLTDAVNSNLGANTRRSLLINPGAITQNTAAATGTYVGLDITMPSLTLTSGTALSGNAIRVTTEALTQTAGTLTSNGLLVNSASSTITTGGVLNGVKIDAPTTIPSAGTYNNLFLGTSTNATANTYDVATIAVGSIASTATQNFSTLNITNGGTGYLDLELIRGFINFQNMNTLYDDFTGVLVDQSKWSPAILGGNSAANCISGASTPLLAGGLNGIFRMITNVTVNRGCRLSTQPTLSDGFYQRGNNPTFETKIRTSVVAATRIFAGFSATAVVNTSDTNASTHHAYIAKKAADTAWQCVTDDGGATETSTSTGVTIVANTFYRLRVELRNGTTPQTICTVDDGTTVTRTVVTATQPGATTAMDVYIQAVTSDTTSKNIDIDYIRAWQDDPPVMALTAEGNLISSPVPDQSKIAEASGSAESSLSVLAELSSDETAASDEASDSAKPADLIAEIISSLFNNLTEFFNKVIFHTDVVFLGRPIFSKDTAGHAFIKAGDQGVSVDFEREYTNDPVVNVSINLAGEIKQEELPGYAVYDVSAQGFKIKLSRGAPFDLNFSWVALAVNTSSGSSGKSIPADPAPDAKVSNPVPEILPKIIETPEQATKSSVPSLLPENSLEPDREASLSAEQSP